MRVERTQVLGSLVLALLVLVILLIRAWPIIFSK